MGNDTPLWVSVLTGAGGDFLGGLCATVLWFFVLWYWEWRAEQRRIQEKRLAIVFEIERIRIVLGEIEVGSSGIASRSAAVITSLLRMPPQIPSDKSFEPILAKVEMSLARVDAILMRIESEEGGVASALRGNDDVLGELRSRFADAVVAARTSLAELHRRLVKGLSDD